MSELVKKIKASLGKSGLALIVSNDYEGVKSRRTLKGTHVDGELMNKTFQDLDFVTHWVKNANQGELTQTIFEVSKYKPSLNILASYKCIVFVFSGHGCDDGNIYMQDNQKVHIGKEIIGPFLPQSCKQLAGVPKLFFIDACRGESKMDHVVVARGSESPKESVKSFVPVGGNVLVAYSTLADYESFEDSTKGGKWMSLLAKHISTNEVDSIESVLTDVRKELLGTYKTEGDASNIQQPETINRLNERVYLKGSGDKVQKKPSIVAVFPSAQPIESSQTVAAPEPVVSSQVEPEEDTYFVSSTSELPPDSSQPQDPAHDTAFQNLVSSSNPPISQHPIQPHYSTTYPEPQYTANTNGVLHGSQRVPEATSTMGPSPDGHMTPFPENYYQQQIWQYSHTHCPKLAEYKETPLMKHEYNHTYYRSTVDLKVIQNDGTSIPVTGDSRDFFVTFQKAREMAAEDAWNTIQSIEQQQQQQLYSTAQQQQQHLAVGPPPPSITVPMTTPQATPTGYNSVQTTGTYTEGTPSTSQIMRTTSIDASPPKGSARANLNEFLQKHGTKPQYSFISESSNGQQRYQCSIKYTLPGKPTRRCTSSGYYASKADAKEQAARKILEEERKGTSSTPSFSSRSSPTKLWKSKLKEYFDKKGQQLVVLEYSTSACSQGYISVVRGPEFGEVEGDMRKSKKEAEQSAAQKAWEKLCY